MPAAASFLMATISWLIFSSHNIGGVETLADIAVLDPFDKGFTRERERETYAIKIASIAHHLHELEHIVVVTYFSYL